MSGISALIKMVPERSVALLPPFKVTMRCLW